MFENTSPLKDREVSEIRISVSLGDLSYVCESSAINFSRLEHTLDKLSKQIIDNIKASNV